MATFPHPPPFHPQDPNTSAAAEPWMMMMMMATKTERRYFGTVKTVNTSPPSIIIVPEDRATRAGYERTADIGREQLVKFLGCLGSGAGEMRVVRVSYVLRCGPAGALLAQDVRCVEAAGVRGEGNPSWTASGLGEGEVEKKKKQEKKKEERKKKKKNLWVRVRKEDSSSGPAGSGSGGGLGEGRVRDEKNVSPPASCLTSQHDSISLEEEARRNARGEFRSRSGGLPFHIGASKWHSGMSKEGEPGEAGRKAGSDFEVGSGLA